MKLTLLTCFAVVGLATQSALAQTAEMNLVAIGGSATIRGGQRITVEVTIDGVLLPTQIRAYQTRLILLPAPGATGTLSLADPASASIFVDTTRSDWLFFNLPAFAAVNEAELRTAATLVSGGAEAATPKYASTYIFEASLDALGDFTLDYVLIDPITGTTATFLLDQNAAIIPTLLLPAGGLTITVLPPTLEPPNDDCVDAFVAPNGSTAFTTEDSTTDGVALDVGCDEGNGTAVGQDVWYEHVATCTGVLTVSTCNDADFDTRLAVYGTGSATCTCPADNTTLEACSDDGVGCVSGTSEVTLNVTAGSCHTIRVGGVGAAEGTGILTISCAPDLCQDAESVSANTTVGASTFGTALNDALGPDCGSGAIDSPGVWYAVTGTGNLMSASLCSGTSYDSRLTVYEGGCGALSCVADANNTCGSQESVTWCSAPGVEYLILVHGSGGASGDYSLTVADQSCNDANGCTDDQCVVDTCTNVINFDDTVDCCTPATGGLTTIDDNNPCTDDVCIPASGIVTHPARPDGAEPACTDLSPCTIDECLSGNCTNIDINGLPCAGDDDCLGDGTCDVDGFCECIGATLELIANPGALSVPGCHTSGGQVIVRVELGPAGAGAIVPVGREIIGAQFFLSYDSTKLSLTSVQPGSFLGTGSPFTTELSEQVDPVAGTIDYLVGVNFGSPGIRFPDTVAVITFLAIAECDADVVYRLAGPNGEPSLLVTFGGDLEPALLNLETLNIDEDPPTVSGCPGPLTVSLDPGNFSAVVTFPTPTASDTCDTGPIAVICDPPSGSAFPAGTTQVTCTASDSCDLVNNNCMFDVTVQQSTLTVDVELSPTMNPTAFERCITFDLWDCDGPAGAQHATVEETLTFTNGIASGAQVMIPGGAWECISARDQLHTLTATDTNVSTVNGLDYSASFVGSPATGGHWLVGGNLNDDEFIDIRDFGIFFPFFLTVASAGTPCGTIGPHANINGDSVVDLLDLVFVSGNSLQASESPCCGAGGAASGDGPQMSISVAELRRNKEFASIAADVNHDNVLDIFDMIAVITGNIPPDQPPTSIREAAQVKTGRAQSLGPRR